MADPSNASGIELDTDERAAIRSEWERLAAEPRPAPRKPYGCAVFLIATLLFLVVGQLPLPSWLQTTLRWILGFVIAGGLFFSLALTSSKYSHDSARAHEAIGWLEAHPGTSDAAARRRHVVTMLYYAVISDDGPTTSGTFNPEQAKPRLAAHLPYILAVEHLLASGRGNWRIFSDKPE